MDLTYVKEQNYPIKMPIIPLITLTFAVFLILWISDLYFTTRSIKKIGKGVEMNPLLRGIIGIRAKFIWPFKILEVSIFSYILWRISTLNEEITFSVLLGLILVYSLVVVAGLKVFIDATRRSTPVLMLFMGILLSLLLFIHLNHVEYQNKIAVSNALSECSSRYANLYVACKVNFSSTINSSEYEKYKLNLSIRR